MASAPTPPPLLPVTNPAAAGSSPSAAGASDAPIATPAFRLFLSRLSDSARRSLSDRRPWGELIDRSAFSKPDSVSDATSRLRRNLAYFRVNYAAVVAFALGASLVAHPFSLFILFGLLAAWCFLYLFRASDQPVVLFGRTFFDRETLLGLVGASFVLLLNPPFWCYLLSTDATAAECCNIRFIVCPSKSTNYTLVLVIRVHKFLLLLTAAFSFLVDHNFGQSPLVDGDALAAVPSRSFAARIPASMPHAGRT